MTSALPSPASRPPRELPDTPAVDPLAEPELFAVAGDWHGAGGFASWVVRTAASEGARTIVHAGDFGVWPGRSGARYLDDLQETLAGFGSVLIVVPGNHEDYTQLDAAPVHASGLLQLRERIFAAPRGFRWTWGGVRFAAVGGATSLDRPYRVEGWDWWPQEELTQQQAEAVVAGGETDVVISHDCPEAVEVPGLTDNWPIRELLRAQEHRARLGWVVEGLRPTHLLHGHFHVRYDAELSLPDGVVTQVTGLAHEDTGRDNFVVLDLGVLAGEVAVARGA